MYYIENDTNYSWHGFSIHVIALLSEEEIYSFCFRKEKL